MPVVEPDPTSTTHIDVRPINTSSQPDVPSRQPHVPPIPILVRTLDRDSSSSSSSTSSSSSSDDGSEKATQLVQLAYYPSDGASRESGASSPSCCRSSDFEPKYSASRNAGFSGDYQKAPPEDETNAAWYSGEETRYSPDAIPWAPKKPGYVLPPGAGYGSTISFEVSIEDEPLDYLMLGFIITIFGNVIFGPAAIALSVMSRTARDKGRLRLSQVLARASLSMSLTGLAVNIVIAVVILAVLTKDSRLP